MILACRLPMSRALLRSPPRLNAALQEGYELHWRSGHQYSSPAMSGVFVKQQQQQWRPKVKAESVSGADSNSAWDQLTAVVETVSNEVPEKVFISLEVNETVVQLIKRRRGKMKRKIELDTKTTLSLRKGKTGGSVVGIQGLSKESVDDAATKIRVLIDQADATDTVDDTSKQICNTVAASQVSKGAGPSQWKPKAGLHTAAGESETLSGNDEEGVSGSIQIDKKLLRLVKGRNDEVKKRIEQETKTKLFIASPIVVKGKTEESVHVALEQIQKVVEEGVNDSKFQYSHFISLPLNTHPALVKQLEEFQKSILTSLGLMFEDEPEAAAQAPTDLESGDTVDEEVEATQVTLNPKPEASRAEIEDSQVEAEMNVGEQTVLDAVFRESVAHSLGLQLEAPIPKEFDLPLKPAETLNAMEEDNAEEAQGEANNAEEAEKEANDAEEAQKAAEAAVSAQQKTCIEVKTAQEKSSEEPEYEPLKEVSMTAKKESKTGIEKSIFIKPSRFHLTVLMLKLWNEERVQKASEVLQKCLPEVSAVLEGRPLLVSLQGLEIMRGSPKNTRVLYAKVAEVGEGDRLLKACKVLIDAFVESGLVLGKDRDQTLKLHATVMNTSHRRSKSKFKNRGFDATQIIDKYGEVNWGEYRILEAHLSQRFSYDEDGYYHCCSSIPLTSESAVKEHSDDDKNVAAEET